MKIRVSTEELKSRMSSSKEQLSELDAGVEHLPPGGVDSDEFWNVFVFVVGTLSIFSFTQSTLAECLLGARLCSG